SRQPPSMVSAWARPLISRVSVRAGLVGPLARGQFMICDRHGRPTRIGLCIGHHDLLSYGLLRSAPYLLGAVLAGGRPGGVERVDGLGELQNLGGQATQLLVLLLFFFGPSATGGRPGPGVSCRR